jgi:hypothetical protein
MLLALLVAFGTACDLLRPREIAAVQGERPRESKPAELRSGELTIRRCFFTLRKLDRSVALEVRTAPAAALGAAWERLAGAEKDQEDAKLAKNVRGVGREARWVGNARSGALYVLGRSAILRLSVGGPGTEQDKIRSCKTLARKVLPRTNVNRAR